MKEEFKTIPSFSDYEISNCGRIYTKSRKIRYEHAVTRQEHFRLMEGRLMRIYFNNLTGYKHVILRVNGKPQTKTIHKLVALTWIPNPNKFRYVNHKDGNKHNNRVDNLEWCTNEYNHEHATLTGLKAKGSQIGSSKLTESSVAAIKRMLINGFSHSIIANMFAVSKATITTINTGKIWKQVKI